MACKQEELKDCIQDHSSEIVGITETWLNESFRFNAFDGLYNVFRQDRNEGHGGGVILAVKSHLQCKLVDSFCPTLVNVC